MMHWWSGKRGGILSLLLVAGLSTGGLGWVTWQALRLEEKQAIAVAQADLERRRIGQEREAARVHLMNAKLFAEQKRAREREQAEREKQRELNIHLALSRLDNYVAPVLVQEQNRPFHHYSAVYSLPLAFVHSGQAWKSGTALEPSPLLNLALPEWILLHFQTDDDSCWSSPQILSTNLTKQLSDLGCELRKTLPKEQLNRSQLLSQLGKQLRTPELVKRVEAVHGQPLWEETTVVPYLFNYNFDQSASANNIAYDRLSKNNSKNDPINEVNSAEKSNTKRVSDSSTQSATSRGFRGANSSQANPTQSLNNDNSLASQRAQLDLPQGLPLKVNPSVAYRNMQGNGEDWLARGYQQPTSSATVTVKRGPMVCFWQTTPDKQERLLSVRVVQVGERKVCQGIVLDWQRLHQLLTDELLDMFPAARFVPVRENTVTTLGRTMSALPVALEPGPLFGDEEIDLTNATNPQEPPLEVPSEESAQTIASSVRGWTPLRIGLSLAWLALVIALSTVALGGWSLLDLSERRIRFVSAVTHELRTPMTTLRLYLDMLTGGMVRDDRQKEEYLNTLHCEADRLNRLISNVLDFSRLEKQQPRLDNRPVLVHDLMQQVYRTWHQRCCAVDKELLLDDALPVDVQIFTDSAMLQQILGNLIDNACKHTREATDHRIWLRAELVGKKLVFSVEDRGPGVPERERSVIFRSFHRGREADLTTGGVGLGLALVQRWTHLLGGQVRCTSSDVCSGACFKVEVPA